jgi:hypothetical protein
MLHRLSALVARHVVLEVEGSCDEVLGRVTNGVRGAPGWATELLLPVTKVGAGPPDFLGRVTGRSFLLHTTWRPSFSNSHNSSLEVLGMVEPTAGGTRIRAVIRPRPSMYWILASAVPPLGIALWRMTLTPELVLIVAAIAGYWLVIVRRDVHLTAIGLSALVAATPSESPTGAARR